MSHFPNLPAQQLNEDHIETLVERMTDALDKRFMDDRTGMTQELYDAEQARIATWARHQYDRLNELQRANV